MAYLDDDFQGYAIGATLPLGSFTGSGFIDGIVADADGTGIPGTDRALQLFLGGAEYVRGTGPGDYLKSFTQWCAHRSAYSSNTSILFSFVNATHGSLLEVRKQTDSTIAVYCGVTGQLLGFSYDALAPHVKWHFYQINVTFSDVMVSGVNKVNIECEIALNGTSIISFNTTTTVSSSGLANGTAEVNRFQLNDGFYGAYTLDTLSAINTYPHGGAPDILVKQAVVEIDELPDDDQIKIFQAVVEVDELPDSTQIQIFQAVVEVDILVITNRWYISES